MKNNLFLLVIIVITPFSLAVAQVGPQVVSISSNSNTMVTRTPDSRGWTDPALNHNQLLQNQAGEGMLKQIGPYRVQGSSYLFGEHHKGDMYSKEAKALNIYLSYNTYNQELEFYSTSNPNKPLMKEAGEVDSFVLKQNKEVGMEADLKFVYGAQLGVKDKFYFQEVASGATYRLYKRYKSDLTISSTNYIQADLRVFDMQTEYYYAAPGVKGLKKIKPNLSAFTKEFKDVKDISGTVSQDEFSINPEKAMQKLINFLNN